MRAKGAPQSVRTGRCILKVGPWRGESTGSVEKPRKSSPKPTPNRSKIVPNRLSEASSGVVPNRLSADAAAGGGHFFRELCGRAASTDAGRSTDFFRELSGRAASIGVKIEPKSAPGGSPGHPKSIQNRSGDLPELPGAPGRHPRASWRIPGAPREGPKGGPGAPEGSPRPPQGGEKGPRGRPETPRDDQNRRRVASGSEKVNYSSHGSLGKASRSDFRMIFASCAQRAHLNPLAQGGVYSRSALGGASRRAASKHLKKSHPNRPQIA